MLKKNINTILFSPEQSGSWNTNGYQYDSTGYNFDSMDLVPFENEMTAYMGVCALADSLGANVPSLGGITAGSVQNVNLSGMDSSKMCLNSIGSTIDTTIGRMGASLNARFEAEKESLTLFGDNKDKIEDLAGFLRGNASEYSAELLDSLSEFRQADQTADDFGNDLNNPYANCETLEDAYAVASQKDPSEWTDADKQVIGAYHADLEARVAAEKAKADENGIYATDAMTHDLVYGEYDKLNSELKALEKDMKAEGMMDYTKWEKGWQDIKAAGSALWDEAKDVAGAVKEGDWKGAVQEAGEFITQAQATGAVVTGAVVSGVADIAEAVVDAAEIVDATLKTPATWLIDQAAGTDLTGKMWDATMDDVARDKVGEVQEWFYEDTALGRSINENSALKYDSAGAQIIEESAEKAGEVAIITAATVATGGAAAPVLAGVGFLKGTGEEAERRFNLTDENGNYTNRSAKDVGMAYLSGAAEAAEWYGTSQAIGAAVQGVNAIKEAGFEGVKKAIQSSVAGSSKKEVAGKLLKGATSSLTEADTWVDVGTGVVDFVVDGVNTGEWNWRSLAVDTAINLGGNMFGGAVGGLLDGANGGRPRIGDGDITPNGGTGRITDAADAGRRSADELFEGDLDGVRGGQPRVPDTDTPNGGSRNITDATDAGRRNADELFDGNSEGARGGQSRVPDADTSTGSRTGKDIKPATDVGGKTDDIYEFPFSDKSSIREFQEGMVEGIEIPRSTGDELHEVFNDEDYIIGVHRAGITNPDLITENGLYLTGDLASGVDNGNNLDLAKNISFFKDDTPGNSTQFLLFSQAVASSSGYKTFDGTGNAMIITIPKDYVDFDGYNITIKPEHVDDLIGRSPTGTPTLKSDYIYGSVRASAQADGTIKVGDINHNTNSTVGLRTNVDELFEGDLDGVRGGQPRILDSDTPGTRGQGGRIPRDVSPTPRLGSDYSPTPRLATNVDSTPRLPRNNYSTPRLGSDYSPTPRLATNVDSTPRLPRTERVTPKLATDVGPTPPITYYSQDLSPSQRQLAQGVDNYYQQNIIDGYHREFDGYLSPDRIEDVRYANSYETNRDFANFKSKDGNPHPMDGFGGFNEGISGRTHVNMDLTGYNPANEIERNRILLSNTTHENIHGLSRQGNGLSGIREPIQDPTTGRWYGRNGGLDEAFTEYLTERVARPGGYYPDRMYCGYQPAIDQMRPLINSGYVTPGEIKQMYFVDHNPGILVDRIDQTLGAGNGRKFVDAFDKVISKDDATAAEGMHTIKDIVSKILY